jgi:D-alanyl-D-alanine dipeptidase
VNDKFDFLLKKRAVAALFLGFFFAWVSFAQSSNALLPGPKPADAPERWKDLIGIYRDEDSKKTLYVLESDGQLAFQLEDSSKLASRPTQLTEDALLGDFFEMGSGNRIKVQFVRDASRKVKGFNLPPLFHRVSTQDATAGSKGRLRTIEQLTKVALTATPPVEPGPFRKPDLVELAPLDSRIHLDIRYATSNNFLGTPLYSQARAFLQRPAADALLRVQQKLKPLGYGLLIHDAYRPWYVTKIFWDATPSEGKIFVADPAQGSRHNRGCAVDLTLYDLATGKPIEMPGTYDEMSPRSFPAYPGGTSLQRWHRDLLRRAMESEGFTVYESEWWHFDYKDWREYPILNVPFEKIGPALASETKEVSSDVISRAGQNEVNQSERVDVNSGQIQIGGR